MTLLSICRDAADEIGLDARPVTVVGNPLPEVQRLLRFAQRVGSDLATRAPWQALRLAHSFTATDTEVQSGAVPATFQRFSPETVWDVTNGLSLTGPVSPVEYQSRKTAYGTAGYSGDMRWFTRRGNDFLVWPLPAGGELYSYEYQSAAFCQSASGTPQGEWLADTDTGRISEELITLGVIARYLAADGQPSAPAEMAYRERLNIEIRNDAPAAGVLPAGDIFGPGRRFTGEPGSSGGLSEFGGSGGGGGGWTWG